MTAICVGGITLVVIPLLALTANQLSRLRQAVQRYRSFRAVHLEEMSKDAISADLIPEMDGISYESSSTLLILCSPQILAENAEVRNALIRCARRRTLRLVAIDEAHIYAMHGRSFCDSMRVVCDTLF